MLRSLGALLAADGLLYTSWRYFCCHVLGGTCCGGVCHCDEGQCCGDVWYPAGSGGECCGDVWYPTENPCPAGQIYLRWGEFDECCGCVPETIMDGRVGYEVNTLDVQDELCCTCDNAVYLPYHDDTGEFVGCRARCCVGMVCSQEFQGDCIALGGEWLAGCCDLGCPAPCCSEDAEGNTQCEIKNSSTCQEPAVVGSPDCETGCLGACCTGDDTEESPLVNIGPVTQAACEAAGGRWQGLGTTECPPPGSCPCREPFDCECCEAKQSKAAGLTFFQPRKKRQPVFAGTFRVRVTGKTESPVLVHGILVGANAESPYERCPFDVTFLMCWESFNIEPVPCGTNFANLDVKVCWEQHATTTETLNFSGCNGITVVLGYCPYECETTLSYVGAGHTSNATIVLRGNAVIDASGTGALVLASPITVAEACVETLTLTGTSTSSNTISGAIGNSPSGLEVSKTGIGRWVLTGANSYSGQLRVTSGTLVVSSVSESGIGPWGTQIVALPLVQTATLLVQAGSNIERGFTVDRATVGIDGTGDSTIGGNIAITLDGNLTLTAPGDSVLTVSPLAWEGGSGVVVTIGVAGQGGVVLIEQQLPSSLASVSIVHGSLRLGGANIVATSTPVSIATATLDLNGQSQALSDLTFTGSSGTITGGTLRLDGAVSTGGTGHEIVSAVTLDATVAFSGAGALLISGAVSGTGGITKGGGGTIRLSASNTYSGTTTINSGTIRAENANAFGSGGIVVNAGGTLDKNGFAIANTITNNGGTVID